MVDAEPLRERRWHLLMVALYRTGRQADALRTYQRARQVLAHDLGIEPGVELRSLEHAILEQDPSLDLPLSTERSSSRTGSNASREGVVFLLAVEADAATERLDRLGDDKRPKRFGATISSCSAPRSPGPTVSEVGQGSGGMLAAFSDAVQALRCTLAMRNAVAERNRTNEEPIAIRIGIHVDEPIHRPRASMLERQWSLCSASARPLRRGRSSRPSSLRSSWIAAAPHVRHRRRPRHQGLPRTGVDGGAARRGAVRRPRTHTTASAVQGPGVLPAGRQRDLLRPRDRRRRPAGATRERDCSRSSALPAAGSRR